MGIAVLWLTAGYFERFRGFIRFLLSLGTVVIVTALGTLSYSTEFSHETIMFLAVFVFLALAVLAAAILARTACRGKYRPARFMLWLALWTVLGSMVAVFGLTIVANFILSPGSSWSDIPMVLLTSVVAGTVLGLGLYILNLPFMILGFVNPFCRERFCNCLRLELTPAAMTPPGATIGQPRKEMPAHDSHYLGFPMWWVVHGLQFDSIEPLEATQASLGQSTWGKPIPAAGRKDALRD